MNTISTQQQIFDHRDSETPRLPLKEHWEAVLDHAKLRPSMFIGGADVAHEQAIKYPLEFLWKSHAFRGPRTATVICSPTQYIVVCNSKALLQSIVDLIDWRQELLVKSFFLFREHLRGVPEPRLAWQRFLTGASGPNLEMLIQPFYLAKRFLIAFKVDTGYWFQSYENGWPTNIPLLSAYSSEVSLLVAGDLNCKWFEGLPFTSIDFEKLIPEALRSNVTAKWHPEDDLINRLPTSIETFDDWMTNILN